MTAIPIKATFFGQTDTGRVRKNNEDAFVLQHLWDERYILSVVIDGLGGYEGGEVAAGIAADTIRSYLIANKEGKPLELLKKAVVAANDAILAAKEEHPELSEMGCVLTAGIVDLCKRQLNIVHIGDTRLYRIADGEMTKLTHDHSLVGYMEDRGQLTEKEAMCHPHRNVIDRFLGEEPHRSDDPNFIDSAIFPLSADEELLFCSDGLYDMLTSPDILRSASRDSRHMVQSLIDEANRKGGRDNVTAVVVCIEGSVATCRQTDGSEAGSLSSAHTEAEGPDAPGETCAPGQPAISAHPVSSVHSGTGGLPGSAGQPCLMSRLWLPCLLAGMLIGYALGNWNTVPIKELKDSVDSQCLLLDSLMNNVRPVSEDSLSCDSLTCDSLVMDSLAKCMKPSEKDSVKKQTKMNR